MTLNYGGNDGAEQNNKNAFAVSWSEIVPPGARIQDYLSTKEASALQNFVSKRHLEKTWVHRVNATTTRHEPSEPFNVVANTSYLPFIIRR